MTAPVETRVPQPWVIRLTHWINVPALAIMAGSGLQILMAYPYMGPRGRQYGFWPLQGWIPPEWARLGNWLGGARAWHFAAAWVLGINGLVYLLYVLRSGEWRRRAFVPRRDGRSALETALFYLRVRKQAPAQGLYNGLQRAAYTGAVVLGILEVLSGLAIYKPTQLQWLADLFGGYDGARLVHLSALFALAAFLPGHLLMVALHWRESLFMVTGGKPAAVSELDQTPVKSGAQKKSVKS